MGISWTQHNKCPNCEGFAGAWKKPQRCRGFPHRDGEGYFCELPNARSTVYNFSGYDLYYHRFDEPE